MAGPPVGLVQWPPDVTTNQSTTSEIWPTCLDCRMALWDRTPYLDQTLPFLGSASKALCFILLSWPDQLVNSECNLQ